MKYCTRYPICCKKFAYGFCITFMAVLCWLILVYGMMFDLAAKEAGDIASTVFEELSNNCTVYDCTSDAPDTLVCYVEDDSEFENPDTQISGSIKQDKSREADEENGEECISIKYRVPGHVAFESIEAAVDWNATTYCEYMLDNVYAAPNDETKEYTMDCEEEACSDRQTSVCESMNANMDKIRAEYIQGENEQDICFHYGLENIEFLRMTTGVAMQAELIAPPKLDFCGVPLEVATDEKHDEMQPLKREVYCQERSPTEGWVEDNISGLAMDLFIMEPSILTVRCFCTAVIGGFCGTLVEQASLMLE